MPDKFTTADVAKHKNEANGFWIIIENDVYDLTKFMDEHPGGSKVLQRFAGKNVTKAFWKYHSENVLKRYGAKFRIGEVGEAAKL